MISKVKIYFVYTKVNINISVEFSLSCNKYLRRRASIFTTNVFQRLMYTCTNTPINIPCEVCICNDSFIMHSGVSCSENNSEILR
jgi:hypothetical protein